MSTAKSIKLLSDRILVKQLEVEDHQTKSGIIIPPKTGALTPDSVLKGEVVNVGPGALHGETQSLIPMKVRTGDKVLFRGGSWATLLRLDNEDVFLIREEDVIGTL